MSKRPFSKIRRINKELQEDRQDKQQPQSIPTASEVKAPHNIYEALRKNQNSIGRQDKLRLEEKAKGADKDNEQQQKPSNIRPLLRTKKDTKTSGIPTSINFQRLAQEKPNNEKRSFLPVPPSQTVEQSRMVRPTPLMLKKRNDYRKSRQKQQVILAEAESTTRYPFEESKELDIATISYRPMNGTQPSDQSEQSTTLKRLQMKIKGKRNNVQTTENVNENSTVSQDNDQQPKKTQIIINQDYHQIELQLQPTSISETKLERQRKRTMDLNNLLNLEIDSYEEIVSISSLSPYQTYINKIKSGFVVNVSHQAFDEKLATSTQTVEYTTANFSNQCPLDYRLPMVNGAFLEQTSTAEEQFAKFVLKVAPVVEELIKPSQSVSMPPIVLLAFKPVFKMLVKLPFPIFVYFSQVYQYGLAVVGEKIYISQGEITSLLGLNNGRLVAGLASGHLALWNGNKCQSTRTYRKIYELITSNNFELPTYYTYSLPVNSVYHSRCSVIGLVDQRKTNQTYLDSFTSLDSSGKLVQWGIQFSKVGYDFQQHEKLTPLKLISLTDMLHDDSLLTYSLGKRVNGSCYFIDSSAGLLCLQLSSGSASADSFHILTRLDYENSKLIRFIVPQRSNLVYTLFESGRLRLYRQGCSHKLFELDFQDQDADLTEIVVPSIEFENKVIPLLDRVYVLDKQNRVWELNFLNEPVIENLLPGTRAQKRDVIFHGLSFVMGKLELVWLMNNLKCHRSVISLAVDLSKDRENVRKIIERNKEMMRVLEKANIVLF